MTFVADDWSGLFGDFTKFGLGAISLLFDGLFMVQHYILYPTSRVKMATPPATPRGEPEGGFGDDEDERAVIIDNQQDQPHHEYNTIQRS